MGAGWTGSERGGQGDLRLRLNARKEGERVQRREGERMQMRGKRDIIEERKERECRGQEGGRMQTVTEQTKGTE
jgi:hypothetical protein